MSIKYIHCENETVFWALERRCYARYGYARPSTHPRFQGKTKGEEVNTLRYNIPIKHPTNGACLMPCMPATCWHTPDLHTKELPQGLSNLITLGETTRFLTYDQAKAAGFPLPEIA